MSLARADAAEAGSEGQARPERPRSRWWVLGVIALAQLMVVLDVTILNIALPSAQRALGFSDDDRQWIITAYSLAFGSLLLLGGRLGDFFGRRRVFLIGVIGFAAASALGGAATGFGMLVIARVIQGAFAALLAPAALSLLTTTFTGARERARAFGIYGAVAGSGAVVGLILGGVLTEYLDWRWTLYVNVLLAVVAVAGTVVFLRAPAPAARPALDLPGAALVGGALFCVVFGFAEAETHPWSSGLVWGFLMVGAALMVAFTAWEARTAEPLLPLSVPGDRDRGASFATVFLASAGLFGVFLFLTYYLQGVRGYTPLQNGLAFLPMMGALMLVAQLATNLVLPRLGPKLVVPAGLLLAAAGMAGLTRLGPDAGYAAQVLPALLVLGAGIGLSMPSAFSLATLGVRMRDQGVASATANTSQQIGGAIGTAAFNTIAAGAVTGYLLSHPAGPLAQADAAVHSYSTVYWWGSGLFAVGALFTALLYRRRGGVRSESEAQAALRSGPPAPVVAAPGHP
jgi:EmrB/QacA subfamily drug resistance transporter